PGIPGEAGAVGGRYVRHRIHRIRLGRAEDGVDAGRRVAARLENRLQLLRAGWGYTPPALRRQPPVAVPGEPGRVRLVDPVPHRRDGAGAVRVDVPRSARARVAPRGRAIRVCGAGGRGRRVRLTVVRDRAAIAVAAPRPGVAVAHVVEVPRRRLL